MSHILDTEEQFFVATKLCLRCSDEILTLTESYPWLPLWRELPGGKVSKADSQNPLFFTLDREVREELGIDLGLTESNTHLFHIEKRYEATTKYAERAFLFLCYLHDIITKPEITLSEHSSSHWMKLTDIDTFTDWRPWFDTIIRKALSVSKKS